jgi:hypothetical protein
MVAGTIVDLSQARATRRKSPDSHAPSPRFIVQYGSKPGTRRVVSYATGEPVNETVYTDADGKAPFELRDKLNAEAEIDERLARLPRLDKLIVLFESADTQQLLADMREAQQQGAMAWLTELVEDFDRAYAEATAGR